MSHNIEHLISTDEAAAILGLTRLSLEQWRTRGRGPKYVKYGRAIRYAPSEIQRWIAERTVASTSEYSVKAA